MIVTRKRLLEDIFVTQSWIIQTARILRVCEH